jgi:hypothetical protein
LKANKFHPESNAMQDEAPSAAEPMDNKEKQRATVFMRFMTGNNEGCEQESSERKNQLAEPGIISLAIIGVSIFLAKS